MNTYTWVGPRPTCEYCKQPMQEWYMFAQTHIHDRCIIARMKAEIAASIKHAFEANPLPASVIESFKRAATKTESHE